MFSRAVSSMSKPAPSSMSGAILPLTVHDPLLGSSTPAMIFRMVDLPEPFVPRMPNTSPCLTSKETSSSARNSLKRNSRFAAAITYSLMLFSCSLAMLKIMDTWSTLIMVFFDESSASSDSISRTLVFTFSGMVVP